MRFAEPVWLIASFLAPAFWLFVRWQSSMRRRRIEAAGDIALLERMTHAQPARDRTRSILKAASVGLSMILVCVALARPQFGSRTEIRRARGMDVVVVLDVSKSMWARDFAPSRFGRAQGEIAALVETLKGDRIGLVGFTSVATPLCPLTTDHAALMLSLRAATPDDFPSGGSAIGEGIRVARRMLESSATKDSGKAIVIMTDGEEHEGDPKTAAQGAHQASIEVHAIGIGSKTGEPIPLPDQGGYMKDVDGKPVISRLDEETLKAIATAGGGIVIVPDSSGGLDLAPVRARLLSAKKAEFETREVRVYEERYRWALVPAFFMMLVAVGLKHVRWRAVGLATLLSASCLAARMPAHAKPFEREEPNTKRGNELLEAKDAKEALLAYERAQAALPGNATLLYNEGLAQIAAGELDKGVEALKGAIAASSDPMLRAQAGYALGNAHRTLKKYADAIAAYQQSLLEDPTHIGARRNLELTAAMKRIAALQPKDPNNKDQDRDQDRDGDDPARDAGVNDAAEPSGSDAEGGDSKKENGETSNAENTPDAGQAAADAESQAGASGNSDAGNQGEDAGANEQARALLLLDALKDQEKAAKRKLLFDKAPKRAAKDW